MEKVRTLFNNKKFLAVLVLIITIGIIKVFLGFIYVKDEPKVIPEKTREDIRGTIKENIAEPLARVIPAIGDAVVEAAYQKPTETKKTNTASTENWKTYKNEEFGFELRYPPALSITTNENVTNFKEGDNVFFSIYTYKSSLPEIEFWEKESGNVGVNFRKVKVINLDKLNVSKYVESGGLGEVHYIFKKDAYWYDLLTLSGDESEIIKILDTLI